MPRASSRCRLENSALGVVHAHGVRTSEIREASGLGLREAKDLSEQLPSRVPLHNTKLTRADIERRFADCRYTFERVR